MNLTFRSAKEGDIPLVLKFIRDLAGYEKMENEVIATEETLMENLFGDKRFAEVVFASLDNKEVGFVLFFHNFSTFLGKPGLYIEDLYVKPDFRGKGIGKELLKYIARLAVERKCGRVEWWVLNWNPARKFYEAIGAKSMDDWTVYRLSGKELDHMASNSE